MPKRKRIIIAVVSVILVSVAAGGGWYKSRSTSKNLAISPEGLVLAARQGNNDELTTILEHGVSPDAPNKSGQYALHVAAFFGHFDTVKLLLEKGANPNLHMVTNKNNYVNTTAPPQVLAQMGRYFIKKAREAPDSAEASDNEVVADLLKLGGTDEQYDATIRLLDKHTSKDGRSKKSDP